MRKPSIWFRVAPFAVLALTALAGTTSARACSVCVLSNEDGLALRDPRLLEVALATRRAVESGVIPEAPATDASAPSQTHDAGLLVSWAAKESAVALDTAGPVHVVLVDADRKFLLSPGADGPAVSAETSGTVTREIITTRRTLLALLNNTLPWDKAREHGLLLVASAEPTTAPHDPAHKH